MVTPATGAGAAVETKVTLEDVARAAYATYGESTGNKNYRGDPMPDWADLGDTIQRAWLAAAQVCYSVGYRDGQARRDSLTLTD